MVVVVGVVVVVPVVVVVGVVVVVVSMVVVEIVLVVVDRGNSVFELATNCQRPVSPSGKASLESSATNFIEILLDFVTSLVGEV